MFYLVERKKKDLHHIPELFLRKRNTQCWEDGSSMVVGVPGKGHLIFLAGTAWSRGFGVGLLWLANVKADNRGPQSLGYSVFVLHQDSKTKYL